jgi:hypothetical protein
MESAVTAWTRWAARRQGLDEAATDLVMTRLPEILAAFDDAYGDPYAAASRGYLSDVAAPDADLSRLAEVRTRREFAAPLPGDRDPEVDGIDAGDSHGRTEIAVAEFAECGGGGADTIRLLTAIPRVVEEIWHDQPASTWEKARQLMAEGLSRHEVLHRLAG